MNVLVTITNKHIQASKGKICNSAKCVVALAIKDVCKPDIRVSVSVGTFSVGRVNDEKSIHYGLPLPEKLDKIRRDFDNERPIKTTTCDVDIPEEFLK